MRLAKLSLALAALCLAPVAARANGLGDYSVVGSVVNTGKPFQDVRAGWPSVDFGYTLNLSQSIDIGPRFGFLYGLEGMTSNSEFGIGIWAPIRFQLSKSSQFNLLFHVDPGLKLFFPTNNTMFGLTFPVGVVMGFPVASGLEVGGGVDLGLGAYFSSAVNSFYFGPMAGPYVEYHLAQDPRLALGLNTRFGVDIPTASGSTAQFAMYVQAFVGYRLF